MRHSKPTLDADKTMLFLVCKGHTHAEVPKTKVERENHQTISYLRKVCAHRSGFTGEIEKYTDVFICQVLEQLLEKLFTAADYRNLFHEIVKGPMDSSVPMQRFILFKIIAAIADVQVYEGPNCLFNMDSSLMAT